MELLQLRYFYESAISQNFSKTAVKYMVPTSTVSASVKRLESELGCSLFDRSSNSIRLNSNGKKLMKTLENALGNIDSTVEELSSDEGDTRVIRILVRAMRSDITDYIIEYSSKRPHVAFNTVFDFGDTDYQNYDIIIDENNNTYGDFENFQLFSMKIRLKASSDSPLINKKICLNQLKNESFVSLNENSNMHKLLLKNCENAGFTPTIIAQINDIECHEKIIESGIAIGLGRESTRNTSRRISNLDISDFDEMYVVNTYYRKSSEYGNVKSFLDFLRKKAQY